MVVRHGVECGSDRHPAADVRIGWLTAAAYQGVMGLFLVVLGRELPSGLSAIAGVMGCVSGLVTGWFAFRRAALLREALASGRAPRSPRLMLAVVAALTACTALLVIDAIVTGG